MPALLQGAQRSQHPDFAAAEHLDAIDEENVHLDA
jgi:hypothetical protein